MPKLSRLIIAGCGLAFVGIGVLHTFVHVSDLSGSVLEQRFDAIGPIALQGNQERAWDLFQGISFLMGFFSMAIGGLLLSSLHATAKDRLPSPVAIGIVIVTLISVLWVGVLYLSALQVLGGGIGAALLVLPLVQSLRERGAADV